MVRWLLEVETYRTLALLGLAEAKAAGPAIRRIETVPLLMRWMQADPVVATALSVPFVLARPPWMFRRRGKPVPDG